MAIYFWGILPALGVVAAVTWRDYPGLAAGTLAALAIILSIGFPFWLARVKRFLARHTVFGGQSGESTVGGGQYYYIYFIAGLIGGGAGLVGGVLGYGLKGAVEGAGAPPQYAVLASLIPAYLSYLLVYSYIQAKSGNLVWNAMQLGPIRFQSTLKAGGLVKLYLTNVLGILFSAGLLIPWAVVRTLKYRADNLRGLIKGDFSPFEGSESTTVLATGAEVGEIFDLDVSL